MRCAYPPYALAASYKFSKFIKFIKSDGVGLCRFPLPAPSYPIPSAMPTW